MTHKRKTIRDAVVTLLKAASITGVGNSVYSNRFLAVDEDALPIINVYTKDGENAEIVTLDSGMERRDFDLVLEVVQKSVNQDDIDDAMDTLAEEVENAMRADHELSGTASDSRLDSTHFDFKTEGALTMCHMRMNYVATYFKS